MKYAEVILDMDENRTVWQVMVFDEDDNLLDSRPFADKQDAIEYAELFEESIIYDWIVGSHMSNWTYTGRTLLG